MNVMQRTRAVVLRALTLVVALLALCAGRTASADIASDKAAALLVFPAIQASSSDGLDTLVRLSNTSSQPVAVHCFYINANNHCSDTGAVCSSGADCSGLCLPGWSETDFRIWLTAGQPIAWQASTGLQSFPLSNGRTGVSGQNNSGSRIPPVSEDPFVGNLTCVAVDNRDDPVESNVLVGSATIEQLLAAPPLIDVVRASAIGIPAIPNTNDGNNVLQLGTEYSSCPQTLIANHFFDGAQDPTTGATILNAIALVPCSQNFLTQTPIRVTAQFLVYNEFEQRFSTSTPVCCYGVLPLSNIDTTQMEHSIFNVGVQGTLTGQTRIQGVGPAGHGLIGTLFDLHGERSTAVNLSYQGVSSTPDVITLPQP